MMQNILAQWANKLAAIALISALTLPLAHAEQPIRATVIPASFADLVETARPAVVTIITTQAALKQEYRQHALPFDEFFRRFFEERQSFQKNKANGLGSGFIINAEGLVVTNHHVIEGADKITVKLNDGNEYLATVLGHDAKTDLALLKIKANKALPYISFGDSDKARVGDWVIAVGNPFGFGESFTAGIISARGRDIQSGPYDDFIQIDAPINKGNSGGPLLNMSGEVIGINTAIYSPNGGNVGIGFAVPSVMAASIIKQLEQHGSVERGWLGVEIQSITKDIANSLDLQQVSGALVANVLADTPAKKAGILPGDVIIEVNGKSIKNAKALSSLIANMEAGKSVELSIWRMGSKKTIKVILGQMSNKIASNGEQDSVELGLTLDEITPQTRKQYQLSADLTGVLIVEVKEGSPAAEKGLKSGDVIMMVNQEKVSTPSGLIEKVKEAASAKRQTVLLLVNRQGRQYFVMLKIKAF